MLEVHTPVTFMSARVPVPGSGFDWKHPPNNEMKSLLTGVS